jgi:hypothetical protein
MSVCVIPILLIKWVCPILLLGDMYKNSPLLTKQRSFHFKKARVEVRGFLETASSSRYSASIESLFNDRSQPELSSTTTPISGENVYAMLRGQTGESGRFG